MLNYVTIEGTFEDGQGNPLSGEVSFQSNTTVFASGVPVLTAGVPIVGQIVAGQLQAQGGGPLQLLATDNAGLTFAGLTGFIYYDVQVTVAGQVQQPWAFFLPSSPSTVQLYQLANTGTPGGGGTVTSASVVSANGFAGTVATDTTTPAITLETTATGVLKGAGGAIEPATAGTDYLTPSGSGAALTGITATQVGADASGAADAAQANAETYAAGVAATAQSNAETFATSAVATETTRAETAEALLIPLAQKGAASGVATLDSGTHVPAAQLPAATTSTQGAVIVDGTAGDIQPSPGTQAAGGKGQAADAGHVHGQPPFLAPTGKTGATAASSWGGATTSSFPSSGTWVAGDWTVDQAGAIWMYSSAGRWMRWGDEPHQFRPESYGALRNGRVGTDAVMTSGSPNLACTTSTPFTSTGVNGGMHILVSTAAGTYAHLATTISTVTDTGHAVLGANATANTGGTPGSIYYFGSDDTAAIQAAINAASAYASSHNGYAEVVFSDGIYIIAGAFTAISGGNCQLGLPVITPGSATQVTLMLRGAMEATPLMHWLQLQPQFSGTVLASVTTSGTDDATNGPSSVIGSPVSGYGHEPGLFSNCLAKIRGLGILVPYNSTVAGVDLYGMVEGDVDTLTVMTAAVVPTSSAPAPSLATTSNISHQWTFAVRMPDTGNQVVSRVSQVSTEGLCYGVCPSEWTFGIDNHVMYAIIAYAPYSQSATEAHSALLVECQAENCGNALGPASWASTTVRQVAIDVVNLQAESVTHPIYDTNVLQGTVGMRILGYTGYNGNFLQGGTGGALLRLINNFNTPGPVASPQAAPLTTIAWPNYYYRDAYIEVALAGGTFSAFTVDAVSKPAAVGAAAYAFMLPAGHSYTPTYSAGTLTHTVTLL